MEHCCEKMEIFSTLKCTDHKNIYECPDVLISIQQNNRHGIIIHDGGASQIEIHFCPWCGSTIERKQTMQERIKEVETRALNKLRSCPNNVA